LIRVKTKNFAINLKLNTPEEYHLWH